VLRYRLTHADGRRVENTLPVGLVRDFPKERDAWREVDRLGLLIRINDESTDTRIRFDALAEHYLKYDVGPTRSAQKPSAPPSILNKSFDRTSARNGGTTSRTISSLSTYRAG